MAWTAPRTYVVGETVTAAMLNVHIRDNWLAWNGHAHGGAAGDGNDELLGMGSVNFDYITTPAAPGASKGILYTKSGGVFYRDGAAGAEKQVSDVGHTHTFVEHDIGENIREGSVTLPSIGETITSSGGQRAPTFTLTITKASMVVACASLVHSSASATGFDAVLSIAGTTVDSELGFTSASVRALQGSLARAANSALQFLITNNGGQNENIVSTVNGAAIVI